MDKKIIKICLFSVMALIFTLLIYITVTQRIKIKKQEMALINIEMTFDSIDYENIETKYDFIDKRKASYIESLCELHTTLKSGGFLFSLQRLNLHNQLTSNRLCSD